MAICRARFSVDGSVGGRSSIFHAGKKAVKSSGRSGPRLQMAAAVALKIGERFERSIEFQGKTLRLYAIEAA